MELIKVTVDRIVTGPNQSGFGVVLRADEKAFVIYVGDAEAIVMTRELKGFGSQRPMSHDIIMNILTAFGIRIRKIVISRIANNIFCATLLLVQEGSEAASGVRNEVRLDLRSSDAIILAMKSGLDLWASREVIDAVEDVSPYLVDEDDEDDEDDESL